MYQKYEQSTCNKAYIVKRDRINEESKNICRNSYKYTSDWGSRFR